jgi:hypothetical protein
MIRISDRVVPAFRPVFQRVFGVEALGFSPANRGVNFASGHGFSRAVTNLLIFSEGFSPRAFSAGGVA